MIVTSKSEDILIEPEIKTMAALEEEKVRSLEQTLTIKPDLELPT